MISKQVIRVAVIFALTGGSALAQTNTFPTSGNVGIGTAAPAYRLSIVGGATYASHTPTSDDGSYVDADLLIGSDEETRNGYGSTNGSNIMLRSNNKVSISALAQGCCIGQISYMNGIWTIGENVGWGSTVNMPGNVGIGTTSPGEKLEISGNLKISGTGSHIHFVDGTDQSTAWTGTLTGGDYAESMDVTGDREQYEPGDVLVLDPEHPGKILKSSERYSLAVAGVYSTRPGVVGRRQKIAKELATTEVPMAMVGVVPTKVTAENGRSNRAMYSSRHPKPDMP